MRLYILLLIIPVLSFSQTSILTGKVYDKEFQDPLPFANVKIAGSNEGATTDFDGNFELEIAPGTYDIEISFIGFQTQKITGFQLNEGDIEELNIYLSPAVEEFDEVIVTAEVLRNTEQSVLAVQKRSANLLDGLSSQSFKKIGARDLSSALKNVPGVSVQEGGFVYVRGLGDRYTKTLINGVEIPGLDPDKNSIQLDIFPTAAIDQVIVLKSATADVPADFTGGIVDIITKDIPTQKNLSLSFSTGYNSNMNLNSNFLKQNSSKTDWLGIDNGLRDLPFPLGTRFPFAIDGDPVLEEYTNTFNKNLRGNKVNSGLDYAGNFSFGNTYDLGVKKLGIISNLSVSKDFSHYDNAPTYFFQKSKDRNVIELSPERTRNGPLSIENNLASALLSIALKGENSKYKLSLLRLQNATLSTASILEERFIGAVSVFNQDIVFFNEKTVSNGSLSGKHFIKDGKLEVNWSYNLTRNTFKDKDIRTTGITIFNETYAFDTTESGAPQRIWRDLDELGNVGRIDLKFNYNFNDNKAYLKSGTYFSNKKREYYIENFALNTRSGIVGLETGDPNVLLDNQNIYDATDRTGTYYQNTSSAFNNFDSSQDIIAFYLSNEIQLINRLRVILGVRFEKYTQDYKGFDFDLQPLDREVINENNLYPSANFVYALNDETNLRASFAKTVARPSFKEASNANIFNPLNDTYFIGNLDIKPSMIDNYDIRYEKFNSNGDLLALSFFYKKVKDPIEIVTYAPFTSNDFVARNVESTTIVGGELEIRKKITQQFKFRFNGSIINSQIKMGDVEFESRNNNTRDGETVDQYRDLQGQSPFLVNAGLEYTSLDNSLTGNLNYNVQGKTLEIVGVSNVPDIYTMPFNSLNTRLQKKLKNDKTSVSLNVKNLLNDKRESEYQSYGLKNQAVFSSLDEGISFSLGINHKF